MNADFFTAISAINDEDDYVKAGNYWRWLKRKLSGDGVQLVSVTHDFKFEARTVDRKTAKLSGKRPRTQTVDRKTAKLSGKRPRTQTVARPGRCLTS